MDVLAWDVLRQYKFLVGFLQLSSCREISQSPTVGDSGGQSFSI